jgi:uncharacterized protein with PQ loop repeat
MDTPTLLALAASSWGVAMALAPILQIRTMLARRSSRDVSLAWLLVLQVGFGLWLAYGVVHGSAALIVPNAIALCVCGVTIAVTVRLRRYRRA